MKKSGCFNAVIILLLVLLSSCSQKDSMNQDAQNQQFMNVEISDSNEVLYAEAIDFYNNKQYILAFYRFMHSRGYLDTNNYIKSIHQIMARRTLKVEDDHVKYLDDDGIEKVIYYRDPETVIETGNRYYSYTNTELYATAIKTDYTLELDGILPDGMYYYLDSKEKMELISDWKNVYNFQANEFACSLDNNGLVTDTYGNFKNEDLLLVEKIVQIYCGKLQYRILLAENGKAYKQYTEIGIAAEGEEMQEYSNIAVLPTGNEPYGIDNEGHLVLFERFISPTSKIAGEYKNLAWIFQTEKYSNYLVLMDGNGTLFMPGADNEFNKVLGTITDAIEVNYSKNFNVIVKTKDGSILQVRNAGRPIKIVKLKGPTIK